VRSGTQVGIQPPYRIIAGTWCCSEFFVDASLLEYRIRGVPGLYLAVDGEVALSEWAPPNFVIALSLTVERTPCGR
jgi:hypothetical protein